MKATINFNTKIKFYHIDSTDESTIIANANAIARALSRLDDAWLIEKTPYDELVAYCTSDEENAVVLPFSVLTRIQYVRYASHSATQIYVPYPMLTSH